MCNLRKKSARMQQCFQRVSVVSNVCNDWRVISDPQRLDVVWEISPCLRFQAGLQGWGSGLESDSHGHLCSLPVVSYQQKQMTVSNTSITVLRNWTVILKDIIIISNTKLKVLETRGVWDFLMSEMKFSTVHFTSCYLGRLFWKLVKGIEIILMHKWALLVGINK